jgi:hypothetical protein
MKNFVFINTYSGNAEAEPISPRVENPTAPRPRPGIYPGGGLSFLNMRGSKFIVSGFVVFEKKKKKKIKKIKKRA